ncbi:MAG: ABC transporter ATP-binding protein, partial [Clostridiales bacterium]|nr:ABC transporter ATP-binding protein [Clostridiales bacterium]
MSYFETENLSVGYHGNILIHGINITLQKGQILTLIGPNGAGKSTILKSITRQLRSISGSVYVQGRAVHRWSARELASHLAVVLTDRVDPELMTCRELVALGRYPHTNAVGKLTAEDRRKVDEALALVGGEELAEQEFSTLSDGQKQRMLLARAICQDTEIIVLDEPTAYLDIRYKVELLDVLRRLAREKGTTILLSLHEIDLAYKVSDQLVCVKGDTISRYGPPEEVLAGDAAQWLYDM